MNQFKTFHFILIVSLFLGVSPVFSGLDRELKLSEINALEANVKKNPDNVKSRLFLGNHYFIKGDWRSVIRSLSPVSEKLPESELYKLSQSYLKIGKYRDSEALVNILLSKDNVQTDHYLLAIKITSEIVQRTSNQLDKKNLTDDLFLNLKKAQKADPTNLDIYEVWLEMAETFVPHYAFDALRVMEDMKKNQVAFRPKHHSLVCKYNFLAEYTKATKVSCEIAIEKDPGNPSNYIYLGQTHISVGDEKKGKRMLASVGKRFEKSEEALWATADSYFQSKNLPEAYKYFKKASLHEDARGRDFLGLAQTAFELKKYQEALDAFTSHCKMSGILTQEFRRASGLLKENRKWQGMYRQRMLDCKPTSRK